MFAQAEALAFGKTPGSRSRKAPPPWLVPHRTFEGNRPSTTILLDKLTPEALGKLVALTNTASHTGVIRQIDSFDQWESSWGRCSPARSSLNLKANPIPVSITKLDHTDTALPGK